jgi:hypothetical protein
MRWARHLYRQAARPARPKSRKDRLRVEWLEPREVPTVTGTAYIDVNLNGVQDPEDAGVAGVTVTATAAAGATETATTAADGTYSLDADADNLRIEFSTLPGNALPGRVTDSSGPLVRFLTKDSDRSGVDLALAAPQLVSTSFFYDDALTGANSGEAAVSAVPYGAPEGTVPTVLATVGDVGSVWGLAYQPASNSLYASSFVKRHAGLGPNADASATTTGGIYKIDPLGNNPTDLLIDLNTAGAGLGTGADPHPKTAESDSGDWFHDPGTLGVVGKRGLGGLAMSPDGRTLYTVNLNTRELIEIPLAADGTRDTSRAIRHTPIPLGNPAGSGIANFNAADVRPFAVAVRGNAVFVGVTYTAETSGSASDLRAFVYAFDPSTGSFRSYNQATGTFTQAAATTPVLNVNLTYPRGLADDPTPGEPGDEVPATWKAWSASFPTNVGQDGFPVHPEPWLTDIAFDGSAMVLGIRDRFGDRGGYQTGNATAGSEDEFTVIAAGDILRAGASGLGWSLEFNGSAGGVTTGGAGNGQGNGGGEFYFQDNADPVPDEVMTGGLAQVPGFKTIAATGNDPSDPFTGGLYTFNNANSGGGTDADKIGAGTVATKTTIYNTFDLNTFGSANGMGDVAPLPADGTVQVGDRVFNDANGNGVQDANEAGISGVVVRLFQGDTAVDSVTTGAGGDFLFSGLRPNTAYQLRIDTTQDALKDRTLVMANQGADDLLDSDATASGTTAAISFTTGDAGTSDHSLDFGFAGQGTTTPTLTLGDRVFRDDNRNGHLEDGETGIPGVTVELLNEAGTTVLNTTTTAADGTYRFTGLATGTYRVRLAASNFTGTGALVGLDPSPVPPAADPNDNVDGDNNGASAGTPPGPFFIVSGPITLSAGAEPTNDGDTDNNTNLTVDFGVSPRAGVVLLGGTIFNDANKDGLRQDGETGIAGVKVELLNPGGTVLNTSITQANGEYSFTNLANGDYRTRLAATNFNPGGPLAGLNPSPNPAADPNNNVDNDSNGTASGTLGSGGFIVTGPVTLAQGSEPSFGIDGDGPDSNRTLDFGLVSAAATPTLTLGNLVFRDNNANGTFDTGDAGIPNVQVELLNEAGTTVLHTATTGTGGTYSFAGLDAGTYRVRLAAANFNAGGPLAGFTPVPQAVANADTNIDNDSNGSASGTLGSGGFVLSGPVTLVAGAEPTTDGDTDVNTNMSVDFGLVAPAAAGNLTLGDLVWNDANGNGTFDTGETGINGVTVELLDSTGAVVGTTTTANGGKYTFANRTAGDYRVRLAATNFSAGGPLANFTASGTATADPDDNVNNNTDGTVSGTLGSGGVIQSGLVTLAAGAEPTTDGDTDANTNLTVDFAVKPTATTGTVSLGGQVWTDTNNNGRIDTGESGPSGASVQLLNSAGTVVQSTTTGVNGGYSFTNLAAGDYKVRLPATAFATGAPLFGFTSSTGTNGAATGGFEGSATPDPDTNTDNDDNGQVSGTLGSSGFIETGLVTLAAGSEPTDDGDGADGNQTVDLGMFQKLSLGNTVFNDANNNGTQDATETGVANVSVRLLDPANSNAVVATATTNSQGQYLFTNLVAGNYVVELAASNFNAGGPLFNFKSSSGTSNAFEPPPAAATDKQDHGTTTGTLGSGGSVRSANISLSATGPTGESPNTDPNTPDAQSNLTADFGVVQQAGTTARISGRVFLDFDNNGTDNLTDTGLAGVTMALTGGGLSTPITVQTDSDGFFRFTNLAAGTYTLTETQPTSPANQSGKTTAGSGGGTVGTNTVTGITVTAGQQASGYNFAEVPLLTTGGFVYEDTNGNGKKDTGEAGIAGVTVTLTGTSAVEGAVTKTATTDSTGEYKFQNLTPGTYTITESQPGTFSDGQEQNGTPAAKGVVNDKFIGINLNTTAASGGFNFGEVKGTGIAGFVFSDANNDGVKAATGEPGIAGVKVRLVGLDDQHKLVDKTVTTGTDGGYSFGSLRPGAYRLVEVGQPAGFKDGKETAGTSNGTTTTNEQITGIQLASGQQATGYLFAEQPAADLRMGQAPPTATINPGGTVTITYTLRNRGSAPAPAASVLMNFGGLTFVSASTPAEFNETTKTWTAGDIAAGDTKTIRLTFRAAAAGTYNTTAQASTTATELSAGNNKSASTIAVGVAAPTPTPEPVRGSAAVFKSRMWFLSSITNAFRHGRR